MPVVYANFRDDTREAYVIAMENLEHLEVIGATGAVPHSSMSSCGLRFEGIASMHAIWYQREAELCRQPWLGRVWTTLEMTEMRATLGGAERARGDGIPGVVRRKRPRAPSEADRHDSRMVAEHGAASADARSTTISIQGTWHFGAVRRGCALSRTTGSWPPSASPSTISRSCCVTCSGPTCHRQKSTPG